MFPLVQVKFKDVLFKFFQAIQSIFIGHIFHFLPGHISHFSKLYTIYSIFSQAIYHIFPSHIQYIQFFPQAIYPIFPSFIQYIPFFQVLYNIFHFFRPYIPFFQVIYNICNYFQAIYPIFPSPIQYIPYFFRPYIPTLLARLRGCFWRLTTPISFTCSQMKTLSKIRFVCFFQSSCLFVCLFICFFLCLLDIDNVEIFHMLLRFNHSKIKFFVFFSACFNNSLFK